MKLSEIIKKIFEEPKQSSKSIGKYYHEEKWGYIDFNPYREVEEWKQK